MAIPAAHHAYVLIRAIEEVPTVINSRMINQIKMYGAIPANALSAESTNANGSKAFRPFI